MDILSILIIGISSYVLIKKGYYEAHVIIIVVTFLAYVFINYVLHIYKYPWVTFKNDKQDNN